jgi:hypothetical protein
MENEHDGRRQNEIQHVTFNIGIISYSVLRVWEHLHGTDVEELIDIDKR